MRAGRTGRAAVVVALALILFPLRATGTELPYWPSDQEERLRAVESELLDVQRERGAARRHRDEETAKELDKKFNELQKERVQLLRATQRLPY